MKVNLEKRSLTHATREDLDFLIYETEVVFFYFSGAGKFCLAHGLRHLTRDVKSDVTILNFRSDVTCATMKKRRMTFGKGR